jgi:hypothetical protein
MEGCEIMAFDPTSARPIEAPTVSVGFDPSSAQASLDEFVANPVTATEVLERKPSMWERFTSPSPEEEFSFKDVLASGVVGTGLGAALGSPTLVGTGPAAAAGGFLGLTSGVAGEAARAAGWSPAAALTAETVAGLGTNVMAKGAKEAIALVPNWTIRQTVKSLPGGQVAENARKVVGEKMFGKDRYNLFNTTENSEATQQALKQQLFGQDVVSLGVNADRKASDILREKLYSSTRNLKQSGNTFSTSPEYTALVDDARALMERGMMSKDEFTNLQKILRLELSKNPKVEPFAQQDILNLIQNGGVYTVAKKGAEVETKTKIPEAAREKLKERFNEYLERNLGSKQYDVLKGAERQEFIAEARDAMPTLLNEGFKFGSPEFTKIINLVKQSPEGKKDLMGALNQHLNSIEDPQKMLKEWQRIAPGLRELGVLDRQGTADIMKKVAELPKNVDKLTLKKNLQNLILFPAVAATGAELQSNDKIPLNPLRMFNM